MATTIDQKVVEMRFDNRDFERNTRQSMSTLDKLKNALHFKGASEGLEKVSDAARKVKMDGLANGIQEVSAKFSALEIIGTTALVNITNSAVNAGKQLVKSLTVDQVTSGWSKMDDKISSVQTLVNSTGKSVEEIEDYLDALMWYSDETSFGFADMTKALANMTSTGGNIDKLVPMIRGMANATAYAGKNAAEFSRVIYNLNQSYGAGHLQWIDWKSVQLAGVNSKQLTEELIKAGEELGTIQKGEVTLGNFSETLKKKWATTAVMERAFGKFDEFSKAVYEQHLATGEAASVLIRQMAQGYDELAIKAFRSAQEAKSFKEAIEATKDATSTAWMTIFTTILGNYEQQKEIFTTFTEWLYDHFVEPIYKIQEFLSDAFNLKKLDALFKKVTDNPISKAVEDIDKKIKGSTHTLEEYQDMVRRIWRGDFKSAPYRKALVEAEGYNYAVTQSLVNLTDELAGYGQGWKVIDKLTENDVIRLEKEFGVTIEEVTDAIDGETKSVALLSKERLDAMVEAKILTQAEADYYDRMQRGAAKYKLSVKELLEMMNKYGDARSLIFGKKAKDERGMSIFENNEEVYEYTGIFQNLATTLSNIFGTIARAWSDTFAEVFGVDLYMAIKNLNEFTAKLAEMTSDENSRGMKNLYNAFRGIFSIVKLVSTIMNAGFKIGWTIFKTVLQTLGYDVLDFAGNMGYLISKVTDFIVNNSYFTKGIVLLTKAISKCIIKIHDMIQPLDLLRKIIKKVGDAFYKLSEIMKNWYQKTGKNVLHEFITDLANFFKGLKETDNIPKYIFEGIINGFKKWGGKAFEAISGLFSKLFGKLDIDKGDNFFESAINCIKGFIKGIKIGSGNVIRAIAEWAGNILSTFAEKLEIHSPSKKFFEFGTNIVQGLYNGVTTSVGTIYELFITICNKLIDIVKQADPGGLIAAIIGGGLIIGMLKISSGLKSLTTAIRNFSSIAKGLNRFLTGLSVKFIMSGVRDIAIAVAILAATVYLLSKAYKNDPKAIDKGMQMVTGLAAIVGVLVGVTTKLATLSKGNKIETATIVGAIIAVAIAMLLMTKAAKLAGDVELGDLGKLLALAIIVGALIAAVNLTRKKLTGSYSGLGATFLSIAVMFLVMAHVVKTLGKLDPNQLNQGMDAIGRFTAMIDIMLIMLAAVAICGGSVKIGLSVFFGIILVLKTMAKVVKSLGELKEPVLKQGMACLLIFVGLIYRILGLLIALNLAQKGSKNAGQTLLGIAAMIAAMALTVKILGEMDFGALLQGGLAMLACVIVIGAFIYALSKIDTSKIKNIQKTLFGVAAMLAAMTILIWLLGNMDEDKLWQGGKAIAAMMILIGGVLWAAGQSKNASKTIYSIVAFIGVLTFCIALLSNIAWQKLLAPMIGLGAILIILGVVLYLIGKMKPPKTQTLVALGMVIGSIVVIALMLKLLANENPDSLLKTAGAIAILMVVLGVLLFAISKIKVTADVWKSLGAMVVIIIAIAALVYVISLLSGLENAEGTINALSILVGLLVIMMIALAACAAIYTAVGVGLLIAIAGLAVIIAALYAVVLILEKLSGIKNAEKVVGLLTNIVEVLIILMLAIAVLGPLAGVGSVGMLATIAALGVATAMIAALGALMDLMPEMEKFIKKGGEILVQVAEILGRVIGAFVGGLLGEFSNALPTIGQNLTAFAEAAAGFFSWIDSISLEIMGKATLMSGVIMLMIADSFISSIVRFLQKKMGTENALVELGKDFSAFAFALAPFLLLVASLPKNTLSAVTDLTKVILLLAAGSVFDAITKWLNFGKSPLKSFAETLPILGEGLAEFAKSLGYFNESKIKTIECGTKAIAALSEASKNVQNKPLKSIVDNIISLAGGDTDLEKFAKGLGPLGKGFASFVDGLSSGETKFDENSGKIIETGVEAIEDLAELSFKFNDKGTLEKVVSFVKGLASAILKKDQKDEFSSFADSLKGIGKALNDFGRAISYVDGDGDTFNADKVTAAIGVIDIVSDKLDEIKEIGDDDFSKVVSKFKDNLPDLGTSIREFVANLSDVDTTKMADGATVLSKVVDILNFVKQGVISTLQENLNTGGLGAPIALFFEQFKNIGSKLSENEGHQAGYTIGQGLFKGVVDGINNYSKDSSKNEFIGNGMISMIVQYAQIATDHEIKKLYDMGSTLGQNLMDGILKPLVSPVNLMKIKNAGYHIYKVFDDALRAAADMNSPSKETEKLGTYIGEGFVMGIEKCASSVYNVGEDVANEAKRGLASSISKISNLINSDMDANPTIRPILDLTNVSDGISQMNSMFSNSSLSSNLGAISTGMNNRNQNGNSDVVSAIDKLGKNLGNSGPTYNINGVTYDDDSRINKAVQDLVRAIEVERRV